MDFKDWRVATGSHPHGVKILIHYHPGPGEGERTRHTCVRIEGKWFCFTCLTLAPEEIAFCAELAGCETFTLEAKYLEFGK